MTRHARTARTVRTAAALGTLAWLLAACGAAANAGPVAGGPTPATTALVSPRVSLLPVTPVATPMEPMAAPTLAPSAVPSAVATPSLAPALVTPAPAVRTPAPTPPPPPPPAASSARTVAILPLVSGGASGSVTEVSGAGGFRLQVTVQGLAPGSVHAIHDHLGGCGGANASQHLTVLAIATADSAGMIRINVPVSSFLFGAGRIVIVYQTASPRLITGCADL